MKGKSKSWLVFGWALAILILLALNGSTGRSYGRVPNYDLMVRDISAGDERIRVPEMEAFPAGDYYYMVSYESRWFPSDAQGYDIHPKAADGTVGAGYSVKCHPEEEFELEPNMTFLNIPMELSETTPDKIKDGFWVKQFIFELDGYCYWVRFESRQGVVEDVQPTLEKITRSLLGEEYGLEGVWEQEITVSVVGAGVEKQTEVSAMQRFEFRPDSTGLMATDAGDALPATEAAFRYTLEGGTLTLVRDDGGSDMVFAVALEGDSLKLESQRGSFDLKRIS